VSDRQAWIAWVFPKAEDIPLGDASQPVSEWFDRRRLRTDGKPYSPDATTGVSISLQKQIHNERCMVRFGRLISAEEALAHLVKLAAEVDNFPTSPFVSIAKAIEKGFEPTWMTDISDRPRDLILNMYDPERLIEKALTGTMYPYSFYSSQVEQWQVVYGDPNYSHQVFLMAAECGRWSEVFEAAVRWRKDRKAY